MRKFVVAFACLALFLAPIVAGAQEEAAPAKKYGKDVGLYMKPFSLPSPLEDGKVVKSDSFLGKPTLFTIIQSACRICQMEVRELNEKYGSLKDKMNVVALMLDVDANRIKMYQEAFKMPYPVLHDADAAVAASVGVYASPATVLVDKDGKIVSVTAGYNEDMLKQIIDKAK